MDNIVLKKQSEYYHEVYHAPTGFQVGIIERLACDRYGFSTVNAKIAVLVEDMQEIIFALQRLDEELTERIRENPEESDLCDMG